MDSPTEGVGADTSFSGGGGPKFEKSDLFHDAYTAMIDKTIEEHGAEEFAVNRFNQFCNCVGIELLLKQSNDRSQRMNPNRPERRVPLDRTTLTPDFLQFNPPRICQSLLLRETENQFGLTGELTPLEGEREQNQLLTMADGRAFVVKVSSATESPDRVDFLIKALQHLATVAPHLPVSRIVPRLDGLPSGEISGPAGERHLMRLLTYMPDMLYAHGKLPTLAGIHEMGRFGGRLCSAFRGYSHPAGQHFMPWDLTNGLLGSEQLWCHGNEDIRRHEKILRPLFMQLFDQDTCDLRQQVTHYDLHPMNLLRADHTSAAVTGVIDFSDIIDGPLICDLAILAWGFIGLDDPVEAIATVVKGYNENQPLTAREIMLLYDLILARAVQMVLLTDFRLKATDNPPAYTRDRCDYMANAERWLEVDRSEVGARLLSACELDDSFQGSDRC